MQNPVDNAAKITAMLVLLLLGACAGSSEFMRDVAPDKVNYTPKPDQALVVFMRPSGIGFAVQSSVFDVTDGSPVFLGIVPAMTKIAHYAPPGKRRYMVIGESADFMAANLDPGKVYYALVTPRMGLWKARFSLAPVRATKTNTSEFADWYKGARWIENMETASGWANSNMSSIREKMTEYLPKWQGKSDKPILKSEDGQAGLFRAASAK